MVGGTVISQLTKKKSVSYGPNVLKRKKTESYGKIFKLDDETRETKYGSQCSFLLSRLVTQTVKLSVISSLPLSGLWKTGLS